jgi:ornithine cyclodeaminase
VSRREVEMPPRFVVPLEDGGFGVMAGAMAGTGHGAKFLTLKHRPGASSHIGALVLLDRETGAPALVLDSGLPTALRTAAVSAVATQALARDDASVLAILGTGEQARSHIEAMRAVRPIERILIWGRTPEKAAALAARFPGARAAATIEAACAEADIICAATAATTPILLARHLREGVHVNAVGASVPSVQEIEPACYGICSAFVDFRPAAEIQAGDLIAARAAAILAPDRELPEIGEVLLGHVAGRKSNTERTLYRSLGLIAQDLALAHYLLRRAEASGRGTVVDLYS